MLITVRAQLDSRYMPCAYINNLLLALIYACLSCTSNFSVIIAWLAWRCTLQ